MSLAAVSLNKNARGDFKSAVVPRSEAQKRLGSRKPRSLWRTVAWPLALGCGFLIFVVGSSIYLVVLSQSISELANRTLQIESSMFVLQAAIGTAESEQRGYLLTGDPDYLDV